MRYHLFPLQSVSTSDFTSQSTSLGRSANPSNLKRRRAGLVNMVFSYKDLKNDRGDEMIDDEVCRVMSEENQKIHFTSNDI